MNDKMRRLCPLPLALLNVPFGLWVVSMILEEAITEYVSGQTPWFYGALAIVGTTVTAWAIYAVADIIISATREQPKTPKG